MATTIKTFITDAQSGKTEADSPYDAMTTFIGTAKADRVTVSTTTLMGDRIYIVVTKTT